MSTRAERSAANRAAHAVKRAQLEEQWALAAAEKQADRKRRREDNRAAWWARYGMAVPGTEQAEQVETSDHVTMPEVTEEQARGIAELYAMDYAERSSAVAQFKPGMVFGDREVVSVAAKSVTVRRIGYADSVKRCKIKRDSERGDYISTNIGELYASRAA